MMNITKCKICNERMEYLEHEFINLPLYKEGQAIGAQRNVPAVNVQFYCDRCECNRSEAFPYKDNKFIKPFIKDVKKFSAKFERRKYIKIDH